jgi:hypothetical protein
MRRTPILASLGRLNGSNLASQVLATRAQLRERSLSAPLANVVD